MTRTQLYERALAITNRLHELQAVNKWSAEEANIAFKVVDEPLPIALHMAGPLLSVYQWMNSAHHVVLRPQHLSL